MIYGFTGPLLPRDMGPYGALTLLVFYSGKGRGGPLPFSSEPLRVPRILLDPGLPLKALEKVICIVSNEVLVLHVQMSSILQMV